MDDPILDDSELDELNDPSPKKAIPLGDEEGAEDDEADSDADDVTDFGDQVSE